MRKICQSRGSSYGLLRLVTACYGLAGTAGRPAGLPGQAGTPGQAKMSPQDGADGQVFQDGLPGPPGWFGGVCGVGSDCTVSAAGVVVAVPVALVNTASYRVPDSPVLVPGTT